MLPRAHVPVRNGVVITDLPVAGIFIRLAGFERLPTPIASADTRRRLHLRASCVRGWRPMSTSVKRAPGTDHHRSRRIHAAADDSPGFTMTLTNAYYWRDCAGCSRRGWYCSMMAFCPVLSACSADRSMNVAGDRLIDYTKTHRLLHDVNFSAFR